MAKKSSLEGRMIEYFRVAPLPVAKIVFGIMRETLKARETVFVPVSKPRRKRRTKAEMAAALGKSAVDGPWGRKPPVKSNGAEEVVGKVTLPGA